LVSVLVWDLMELLPVYRMGSVSEFAIKKNRDHFE
jgi:hypothetical protein